MPRVRIERDTFLALGPFPIEYVTDSGKQRHPKPSVHGRVYTEGEEIEVPEKHPNGEPFVIDPAVMTVIDDEPPAPVHRGARRG